jgi:hypothetical protein
MAFMAASVILTVHLVSANDKGQKSFRFMGTIQSVDVKGKRLTLEYPLAPNVLVKSGRQTQSLQDLAPGTRVRLRGLLDAQGIQTVYEITSMAPPATKEQHGAKSSQTTGKPQPSPRWKAGKGKTFRAAGVIQSLDVTQKRIALSVPVTPNVVVKQGKLTKSLADLSAGTRVSLRGSVDAHGDWMVEEIKILTAMKASPAPRPHVSTGQLHP